jgi:hypothetical protein
MTNNLTDSCEAAEPARYKKTSDDVDLHLDKFVAELRTRGLDMLTTDQVKPNDAEVMASVGVHLKGEERSGTYFLSDFGALCLAAQSDDFELLAIADALRKYDWLNEKYYWKAVTVGRDKYTETCASVLEPQGYFIHVKKGAKVVFPIQACLYMPRDKTTQKVHNIIILEENSELQLITGCATGPSVGSGTNLGITEQYIGKSARLTSTMIHSWGSKVEVRPRSGTIVEEGGRFVSTYCSLRPARNIQTESTAWLNGSNASAKYVTIVLGSEGSTIDTDSEVHLNGVNSSAEITSRVVCTGGHIYQRGLLSGNAKDCRAHVDCAGMILDAKKDGFIQAVPGLRSLHPDARMSHEASIGKIAPEQVAYMQSRGMEEHEAISMIIRGFLDINITGLNKELDAQIARIAEISGHGEE